MYFSYSFIYSCFVFILSLNFFSIFSLIFLYILIFIILFFLSFSISFHLLSSFSVFLYIFFISSLFFCFCLFPRFYLLLYFVFILYLFFCPFLFSSSFSLIFCFPSFFYFLTSFHINKLHFPNQFQYLQLCTILSYLCIIPSASFRHRLYLSVQALQCSWKCTIWNVFESVPFCQPRECIVLSVQCTVLSVNMPVWQRSVPSLWSRVYRYECLLGVYRHSSYSVPSEVFALYRYLFLLTRMYTHRTVCQSFSYAAPFYTSISDGTVVIQSR